MEARRLVGMSMSARKRAARHMSALMYRDMNCPTCFGRDDLQPCPDCVMISGGYRSERNRYRVGQRLQPCTDCGGQGFVDMEDEGLLVCNCEGTGVLPARRAISVAPPAGPTQHKETDDVFQSVCV